MGVRRGQGPYLQVPHKNVGSRALFRLLAGSEHRAIVRHTKARHVSAVALQEGLGVGVDIFHDHNGAKWVHYVVATSRVLNAADHFA